MAYVIPTPRSARNRLASASSHYMPADVIADRQRDLATANIAAAIRDARSRPQLTNDQVAALIRLLFSLSLSGDAFEIQSAITEAAA